MSQINSQYIAITDNYTNGNKSDAKQMIAELSGNQLTDFIRHCISHVNAFNQDNYEDTNARIAANTCMKYALTEIETRLSNYGILLLEINNE